MLSLLSHIIRSVSLVLVAILGTSVLVYVAPGYFSDEREMDAAHADIVTAELARMHRQQGTVWMLLGAELRQVFHADLGTSRQLDKPVIILLSEAIPGSARLLAVSVALGWCAALLFSLLCSFPAARSFDALLAVSTSLLLAIPIGALGTFCLLTNHDVPILVLALVVFTRDFKLLHRKFQNTWRSSYLLYARAQGFSTGRIIFGHILPCLQRELCSVAVVSLTLALSALVPIEVLFDRSGIGKLAWNAAMNRDLPVLVGTTALVAGCVGLANSIGSLLSKEQGQPCAR